MEQLSLKEIFAKFDNKCFELCKENEFCNENEFVEAAIENCSMVLMEAYYYEDDEDIRRRVVEWLDNYLYRDPDTDLQMSFLEWSKLFHTDEYSAVDNIDLLYEHCKQLKKRLDESNTKLIELKTLFKSAHDVMYKRP